MIDRESIVFARAPENKKEENKSRNNVAAEIEERVVQEMAKGHDDQDAAEGDQRVARAQTENEERAGDEFDKWNNDTGGPKRPDRQEGVAEREKIFSRMLKRAHLKNFHDAGHEKDEAEDKTSEEQSPGAVRFFFHRFHRFSQIEDESGKQELRKNLCESA